MPYLDSIFVNDEQAERIAQRAKALHVRGRVTFADAMVDIITAGLDAMDAQPAEAQEAQAPNVEKVDPPGESELLTSAPDPLAAMTGQ